MFSSKSKRLRFIKGCKGCQSWLCDDGPRDGNQKGERDRLSLMMVENVKVLSNSMNILFEHIRGVGLTFEPRHLNKVIKGKENMPCFQTDKSNTIPYSHAWLTHWADSVLMACERDKQTDIVII